MQFWNHRLKRVNFFLRVTQAEAQWSYYHIWRKSYKSEK